MVKSEITDRCGSTVLENEPEKAPGGARRTKVSISRA
jgi:hypothetical protein